MVHQGDPKQAVLGNGLDPRGLLISHNMEKNHFGFSPGPTKSENLWECALFVEDNMHTNSLRRRLNQFRMHKLFPLDSSLLGLEEGPLVHREEANAIDRGNQ